MDFEKLMAWMENVHSMNKTFEARSCQHHAALQAQKLLGRACKSCLAKLAEGKALCKQGAL
eukprot:11886363-Heterocapsa_arctica.AAC.1